MEKKFSRALCHYSAEAVYFGYLFFGRGNYRINIAEMLGEKLRRFLPDMAYAQSEQQARKVVLL